MTRTLALVAVVALALGLMLRAHAGANVPSGIGYSGVLENNGAVERGTVTHDFIFELFDGSTALCSDTRAALAVSDGRFDAQNLFASGCALDAHLAWLAALQLRITVDSQILSPPQPLGAVPFALRARVAESAELAQAIGPAAVGGGSVGEVVSSLLDEAQFQAERGTGWVLADGRDVTGSRYHALTTRASVPDLRGVFLRGKNHGRSDGKQNPDGELAPGAYQADQFGSHDHGGATGANATKGWADVQWAPPPPAWYSPHFAAPDDTGSHTHPIAAAGGNETRPRSATVSYFVRIN